MTNAVIYSTLTGNAKKIADAVYGNIPDCTRPQNIMHVDDRFLEVHDVFVLCYWCNRGTADPLTMGLLKVLKGKKVIMLGTLGAYPDSPHGQSLRSRIKEIAEANNTLLGNFICQGKIDPARTERRLKIPAGQPHHLDEEGYRRHLESRKHPDESDIKRALDTVRIALGANSRVG